MLARTGTSGTNYRDPNQTTPYGRAGCTTPTTNNNFDASPTYPDTDGNGLYLSGTRGVMVTLIPRRQRMQVSL